MGRWARAGRAGARGAGSPSYSMTGSPGSAPGWRRITGAGRRRGGAGGFEGRPKSSGGRSARKRDGSRSRQLGPALAVGHAPPRQREGEPRLRPGHADVAEPPLLVGSAARSLRPRPRVPGALVRAACPPPARPGRPRRTPAPWRRGASSGPPAPPASAVGLAEQGDLLEEAGQRRRDRLVGVAGAGARRPAPRRTRGPRPPAPPGSRPGPPPRRSPPPRAGPAARCGDGLLHRHAGVEARARRGAARPPRRGTRPGPAAPRLELLDLVPAPQRLEEGEAARRRRGPAAAPPSSRRCRAAAG